MRKRTLAIGEVAAFCEQIGMIIQAGVSLEEGLALMEEEMRDAYPKEVLGSILKSMHLNNSFHKALEETGAFPCYMIQMIKVGTEAGRLEQVMQLLSRYYEREKEVKEQVRAAITYPLLLIGMMGIVILILALQVLPVFQQILNQMGTGVTGIAKGVLYFGNFIKSNSMMVGIGMASIIVVILLLLRNKENHVVEWYQQRGKLQEKLDRGRIASILSLMVASGLDIPYGLQFASKVTTHREIQKKLKKSIQEIDAGASFVQAVEVNQLFSPMVLRMLAVGNRTGNLDAILGKIAATYENEVESLLEKRIGKIEPMAIFLLALFIGSIVVSVMIPLMRIMASIG